MATEETKRYMELQMQELKEACAATEEENPTPKKKNNNNNKNAEIAKLYEDAAEYEEDLKGFEAELEIVKTNSFADIPKLLVENFSSDERDYVQEIKNLLELTWKNYVQEQKPDAQEQLKIIQLTELSDLINTLAQAYPDDEGDFETKIKDILITRWETLIAIKKEHIKEEIAEIKIMGLKPNYVQRIYKQFHGIE
ncbi:hypothetical protein FJR45_02420 [Sulfurimonas sediminis]|uniref:Uncharacterized protein n=1 Tax=Sulfurimonas sediminis TaxID=2590020 RepID=A0A7M1AZR3_9BACT|nr:hypothetical protein [Sulfurimonas sediminis]QOP42865.1 hypothetical protein FJR45_02420 [Sulfurimonas sediminis]